MGQAKRRKMLDPNFGKTTNSHGIRKGLAPDFGEACRLGHYPTTGSEIIFVVDPRRLSHYPWMIETINGVEYRNVFLKFSAAGVTPYAVTFLIPVSMSEKTLPSRFVATLTPEDRYLTKGTRKWVTPFYVRPMRESDKTEIKTFIEVR